MATSLVFTGHMVDLPGRAEPRFPPSLEKAAERRIAEALDVVGNETALKGFASAARGGDILFHEQCRLRGIPTVVILPFAPEDFIPASVAGLNEGNWTDRFWSIWNATPAADREVMNLPVSDETAYGQCNIKLLERAREFGRVHLIALWDGKSGDGPGGTADLISRAGATDAPDVFSPASLPGPKK